MDEDIDITDYTENMEKSQKDRGWAWVITAGATLHLFFIVGMTKSFGLFFVEFLSFYDTNSSVLSGMIAAQNVVSTLSSLLVLNIGNRIVSNRALIIAGGIMSSAGYLFAAFSPNVVCLVLSQSIFIGIGISCTTAPIFVVLNSYFEKRLGFANSLVNVGGGIGGFVMPFIIKSLLDRYGLRGALLIISGLILNEVVAGFVMRAFPSKQNVEKFGCVQDTSAGPANKTFKGRKQLHSGFSISFNNVGTYNGSEHRQARKNYDEELLAPMTEMKRSVSDSCCIGNDANDLHSLLRKGNKQARSADVYRDFTVAETSMCSITSFSHSNKAEEQTNNTAGTPVSRTSHCLIFFGMLKNYRLLLVLFVAFVSYSGSAMIGTYIPPFATDQNVTTEETAILVMIVGGCGILSRLILTLITDSQIIHRYQIMGVSLGIIGIATMLNPLFKSFEAFIAYSVFHGLFGSVYFSIVYLLLRESVGPDKMSPAFSLMITTHGLSSLTIVPLLGYLRDSSGSYTASFYVMGIGLIIGSIASFCVPLVKRFEERRLARTAIIS